MPERVQLNFNRLVMSHVTALSILAQRHHQVVKSTSLRCAERNLMRMAMSHHRRRMKAIVTER